MSLNPAQLALVKADLLAGHPVTGPYAAGDEAASDQMNVNNRPADGSVATLLTYLLVNKSRTNAGSDTVATSMLGRLIIAANAAVGTDPFGAGTSFNLTLDMKCSVLALLEIVRNQQISRLPYQSNALQQILTDVVNAGVMRAGDRMSIIAFSNNLQSRAQELVGVRMTPSDIAEARRLP